MVFIGLIVILAAADLYIKHAIEEQEPSQFPRPLKEGKGKVTLHQNHNPGFSFGVMKGYPGVVSMIPVAVVSFLAGVLTWLLGKKGFLWEKIAVSITLGGAISNLYDRLVRHYVVDYFTIEWKWLKKVVFNLGDFFIFLGTGMMVLQEILRTVKER